MELLYWPGLALFVWFVLSGRLHRDRTPRQTVTDAAIAVVAAGLMLASWWPWLSS